MRGEETRAYTTLRGHEPCGWEVEQIKKNKWQTVSVDPDEGGGSREMGEGRKKQKALSCLFSDLVLFIFPKFNLVPSTVPDIISHSSTACIGHIRNCTDVVCILPDRPLSVCHHAAQCL